MGPRVRLPQEGKGGARKRVVSWGYGRTMVGSRGRCGCSAVVEGTYGGGSDSGADKAQPDDALDPRPFGTKRHRNPKCAHYDSGEAAAKDAAWDKPARRVPAPGGNGRAGARASVARAPVGSRPRERTDWAGWRRRRPVSQCCRGGVCSGEGGRGEVWGEMCDCPRDCGTGKRRMGYDLGPEWRRAMVPYYGQQGTDGAAGAAMAMHEGPEGKPPAPAPAHGGHARATAG